jgi:hypothetical protein
LSLRFYNTKIGVSGFFPELVGKVSLFDIDAFEQEQLKRVRESKSELIVTAGHFFFSHQEVEIFQDRISQLADLCEEYQAQACNLRLPPSFFNHGFHQYPLPRFLSHWKERSRIPVMIDLPKQSTLPNRKTIDQLKGGLISLDPLWIKPKKTYCWKIHGWHDGRWVRFYSTTALEKLAMACKRWNPEVLIFAHSQRLKQSLQFLDLDESS